MQLDFFSDLDTASLPASMTTAIGPHPAAESLDWARNALVQAFEGRRLALKTLEENKVALEALLYSIWNVASAKRISYDQALRGLENSSFGWANSPLAADIEILSSFHISMGQIPMSPCAIQQ